MSYRHATSLFVLTITAFTASPTHAAFHLGIHRAIVLSVGAIPGAQVGAKNCPNAFTATGLFAA